MSDGAGALSRRRGGHGSPRRGDIAASNAPELVWLLEHPPLYTSGTSGKAGDLLEPRFPVFAPAAAASSPITAPASEWPMSCST